MKKEDLTYKIRGAIFEVNRILGHGFLEKVYENALMVELQERGLKAEGQGILFIVLILQQSTSLTFLTIQYNEIPIL